MNFCNCDVELYKSKKTGRYYLKDIYKIMSKYQFFLKKKKELHLTTSKKIRIIKIANIIKKLLKQKGIDVKIYPSKKKDELQNNIKNISNQFFLKFWKSKYKIENGIDKIIRYYDKR